MAKKKKTHATGQNIMTNLLKRLKRAERKGKSANYINDLKKAMEKHH